LKTELIGLAVIGELPLVLVNVQRGGPSTGLPTKVEQADLLAALFASPGDAPKIIIAPSTIEECFHFMVTARKLAEDFRMPVFLLSDANLATGVQPFKRPEPDPAWLSPPLDQSDWNREVAPFDWDETTGLSQRPIPGQRDGMYVLTGLAHDRRSRVAYESSINQHASAMRSRKMITLLESLNPPQIYGDPEGDLLVVGWGSTRGAIEEAVDRQRAAGAKVSAIHLRFLAPLEPGLKPIFQRFKKVLTVEINYSDIVDEGPVTQENRRYAQLAMLLRAKTLCDVDCWSRVPGGPLSPAAIENALSQHLKGLGG
ncbi:MAG: 2-oxoacid:acceptor oxidoreductase subunit alpha, partial [Acidobacteria bacterium]|nr:2-oxoacid:acceptor oxidoreductase subunit alpha [Acidobacteriota bacterium]